MNSDLIVMTYAGMDGAPRAWQGMGMLRDRKTLGLEYTAVVKKEGAGLPVIHRFQRLPAYPPNPRHLLLGQLADEVFCRSPQQPAAKYTGAGIDELFVERVGHAMGPDSSALMIYIPYDSVADVERLVNILALLQGTVHRTTLPPQVEKALLSREEPK